MSETVLKEVFGVSEGYRVVSVEHEGERLRLPLEVLDSPLIGPECARPEVSRKGRRHRELPTVPIGRRPAGWRAEGPQGQCRDCPHRFEVAPPFAPAYRRLTHRLVAFGQTLAQGMCRSDVAPFTGLAWDTVKDWVKEPLEQDDGRPRLKGLRSLSIDEIYVGKTRKFYPLVSNLEEGRIVGVAPGKQGASRKPFWRARRPAKAKLKAVGGDLSRACWRAVAAPLPEAALGFDRFPVVKRMNEQLDDRRRALWREAQGLMKQRVKGTRSLRRRRPAGPPGPGSTAQTASCPPTPTNRCGRAMGSRR